MKINRRTFFKEGSIFGAGLSLSNMKLFAKNQDNTEYDIFEIIKNRRSVRNFKSTPIPKEHIDKILEAANFAPTPQNRQAWKFLVIQERKTLDKIKEVCIKMAGEESKQYYTDYLSAPVYIVVIANTKTRNPVNDITAGALAALNLMLAARALGYGTVFCANSIPEEVTKEILNIPDDYKRICITPVGVPVEWPETPKKKSLKEVVLYEEM